jgi:serine/threonine protein kinase
MKEKRKIIYNIAKCINFCHQKGILHKDLKLENVMITPELQTTLVDFGYSEVVPQPKGSPVKLCGTPFYVPPEFIKKEAVRGNYFLFLFIFHFFILSFQ